MQNFEDILDKALNELKKGKALSEVALNFPDSEELKNLLAVSAPLLKIQKTEAPEPIMKRKYANLPESKFILRFSSFKFSKFAAVGMSSLLLISAIFGTSYAAFKSLPGSPLYSLKKTSEQVRLTLATTEEAKANLQVEFVQNRTNEAEKVLQNPESNSEAKQVALNEMLTQTQATIATVNKAAKSNSLTQKNNPIVSNLENLAKKQQEMVSQVKSNNTTTLAAATKDNLTKVEEIKKYIQVASNEQTLAKLEADPNLVTITGSVAEIVKNIITVEKTSFIITDKTQIQTSEYNPVKIFEIKAKDKVKIFGYKENDTLFANQIIVFKPELDQGKIEGTSTSTEPSASTTTPKILEKSVINEKEAASPQNDPNIATGGIILEPFTDFQK
jgi:hypothetical protein